MKIELLVANEDADVRIADCESIEDFEDELRAAATADHVRVDFHPAPQMPFTVLDAVETLVSVLSDGSVTARCTFASERAVRAAERLIPSRRRPAREAHLGGLRVVVLQGDIVAVEADAIVNASNVRLELGAGVSGAIRRTATHADALQADMRSRAPIQPSEVVVTPSHGLPHARHILHAATASGREDVIGSAYARTLALADRIGVRTLAIVALGTGTGGLPVDRSAALLRQALDDRSEWRSLHTLRCVLYEADAADAFATA